MQVDEPVQKSQVLQIELTNSSDADLMLRNVGELGLLNQPDTFTLPAQSKLKVWVMPATLAEGEDLVLEVEVLNAIIAPGEHPVLAIHIEDC